MQVEISKDLAEAILDLNKNFDNSDESCFEEAAMLIPQMAQAIQDSVKIRQQEFDNHVSDLIDSIN